MAFTITSDKTDGESMYEGQIIAYTLKPLLGIKVKWMTEITHIKPHDYFVDEQRFGPYKLWHHRHIFKKTPTGVEMQDMVNYALPFGFIGTLAHKLFLRKRIEAIFDYRTKVLNDIFRK